MVNNTEPIYYPIEEYHKLACDNFIMEIDENTLLLNLVTKHFKIKE